MQLPDYSPCSHLQQTLCLAPLAYPAWACPAPAGTFWWLRSLYALDQAFKSQVGVQINRPALVL